MRQIISEAVGGGRVGQVIETEGGCQVAQDLLFVDCTTGSAIMVAGRADGPRELHEREWFGYVTSARALQPPYGPLALSASTTVAEVAALAAREGWRVETDVPGYAAERGRRNAFDPFMGCEIFYPGSVGAGR